jgi:hypothetical protein
MSVVGLVGDSQRFEMGCRMLICVLWVYREINATERDVYTKA